MQGNLDICKLIIENVANKNTGNQFGTTPLHEASRNGRFEICKLILDNVTEKNPADNFGETPLHSAASRGKSNF